MFVVLTLVSLEMIKHINQEKPFADFGDKRKRVEPKTPRSSSCSSGPCTAALVLITLTGVFPAIDKENDNRDEAPRIETTSNNLHLFGVLTACSTLVLGMMIRAILFRTGAAVRWRSRTGTTASNTCTARRGWASQCPSLSTKI